MQLVPLQHGVSPAIILTIIAATLAPCVMADSKETRFLGEGIAKYRPEPRAKGGQGWHFPLTFSGVRQNHFSPR